MFPSGFIEFWTSKTWFWQKSLRIFLINTKESEIFGKAQNYLWDIVKGETTDLSHFKVMLSQESHFKSVKSRKSRKSSVKDH